MVNLETSYTAQELADLQLKSLPHTRVGVMKKAKKSNWTTRKRVGRGGGLEYAFESLPEDAQNEIHIKVAKQVAKQQAREAKDNQPKQADEPKQANYLPEVLWSGWEDATAKQKQKATEQVGNCFAVDDLINTGMGTVQAIEQVAADTGVSKGSLKRWYYKVRNFERSDWLPILIGNYHKSKKRQADFTPEAWEAFKADYLRLERPQMGTCYERLKLLAKEHGWTIPSLSSVKRKLKREVPMTQQVLLRQGDHKLFEMYPSLQRSVESLEAMEWINGDGYKHNVFVEFPDGEICRPVTWFWQDVRTRKILAYRTDKSENTDTIRLSLMDLIYRYGIPREATIDNTRAAANKKMTGGVPNRYRFKVKEDEPDGILKILGIKVHWTSVNYGKGHGQAKPIERAFSHGGLGETVDKDMLLRGHNTGGSAKDKPDNYHGGKRGASYEDFITALDKGVDLWNNREGRDTELCLKRYSFNQVFERDYAQATIRRATTEQMRLLMLTSEAVTLKHNGTFESHSGGSIDGQKNRYEAVDLIGSHHKKVVIRFDPQKLHENVLVYSLDGRFLAEAVCTKKVAFGDTAKAREHSRDLRQRIRHEKAAAKAQLKMTKRQYAELEAAIEVKDDAPPIPSITEIMRIEGNTVRKQTADADDEWEHQDDYMNYIAMLKKEMSDE
ncbi:DDE endonuclease [Psychrobacter sp. FDAARGOS_221]|nr:DDE endonuclease [Psychrobacter sp. FDAARGOS_221]